MVNRIKITYVDSQDIQSCYLTKEQAYKYNLEDRNEYVIINIGICSIKLKKHILRDTEKGIETLCLSSDIKEKLYIDEGTIMQISAAEDGILEIGPYIGIFINQSKIEMLTEGNEIYEYTWFDKTSKHLYGYSYFFSIEGIDWDKCLIKGVVNINGRWIFKTCLFPKVIYDRNVENNSRIESFELRERLCGRCKIINSIAKLTKLSTIKVLEKNEKLINLIPQTVKCNSCKDIERVMESYRSVYLKPDSLSKGKGVYKITKKSDNHYKVEYRTAERNHVVTLNDIEEIDILLEQYSENGGGYIIQKEINKALFRGNTFDLRVLFQKDYSGTWKLSGIAARVAAEGSIITSPRSGGVVEDFSIILKEVFGQEPFSKGGIYERLVYFGREICSSIEKAFGDCVELGLDMAIDINHKIWIIEVNGKPLKVSLKRLNNPEIMARYLRRPIEYAASLTNFASWDTSNKY